MVAKGINWQREEFSSFWKEIQQLLFRFPVDSFLPFQIYEKEARIKSFPSSFQVQQEISPTAKAPTLQPFPSRPYECLQLLQFVNCRTEVITLMQL